jgi:flavin reductase (DIM6/NTAB) family NADH-FMN oxidoreductase RutF
MVCEIGNYVFYMDNLRLYRAGRFAKYNLSAVMQSIDHQLTQSPHRLIEPGPIVLVTTFYKGKNNIMTMGFHGMVQHDPPLICCVIGPWDFSYQALKETGECVIAIPAYDLAGKVVEIGNCSGQDHDKFEKFGLTAVRGKEVKAPLIDECLANIECRVKDTSMVGRYSMFILEALLTWTDADRSERRTLHHNGDGTFNADGEHINLKAKMTKWPGLI